MLRASQCVSVNEEKKEKKKKEDIPLASQVSQAKQIRNMMERNEELEVIFNNDHNNDGELDLNNHEDDHSWLLDQVGGDASGLQHRQQHESDEDLENDAKEDDSKSEEDNGIFAYCKVIHLEFRTRRKPNADWENESDEHNVMFNKKGKGEWKEKRTQQWTSAVHTKSQTQLCLFVGWLSLNYLGKCEVELRFYK